MNGLHIRIALLHPEQGHRTPTPREHTGRRGARQRAVPLDGPEQPAGSAGLRKTRRTEYRASKCRTRRTALNARRWRSEECSIAFTLADVELRRARFRRAHPMHQEIEPVSRRPGDTLNSESQECVIDYPLESRQLVRCNEKNAQITETNTNSQALSHSVFCLYASCHVVLRRKGMPYTILPLRAQKRGNTLHERPVRILHNLADIWIPIKL